MLRSPDAAYFPSPRATSGSSPPPDPRSVSASGRGGRKVSGRGKGEDAVDGLGLGMELGVGGFNEYHSPSPTHAYLETFDSSYAHPPDPTHTPIPQSPSIDSPYFTEKDPLDAGFEANQFPSDRYLAPTSPGVARSRRRQGRRSERGCMPTNPTKRRWIFCGIPALILVIVAVAIGVVVALRHSPTSTSTSGSGLGSSPSSPKSWSGTNSSDLASFGVAGTGKNGTIVTTDLGVNYTYINWFGGSWAQNPESPYSVSGQAQSYSPSLLEKWVWGQHFVRGVNLGGWLVTEPFIAPALYEAYQNTTLKAIDEYTLSQAMGDKLATAMEEHYKTFITEEDFADIANAGLNWVRIPLGYWAIETQADEPFLPKVSWTYFLKAIAWGRKYGIRISLDFHALPGSQNGWNHSGKAGAVNWMYGVMGLVNGQRHLENIRTLTEFISQEGIKEVVPVLSLVNEVQSTVVGLEVLQAFYYQAYEVIRGISGFGVGNGPIIAMHEGFAGIAEWNGFLNGADRVALDQHPYLAFTKPNNDPWDTQIKTACGWGGGTNDSQSSFGIILGGEWSNAINDCGKWLDGVDSVPAYTTISNCSQWEEWFNWSDDTKAGLLGYAQANMDALQNWFFWTWKIGNSTELGYSPSPFWHYKLGWQNGWIPADPRVAGGYCSRVANVGGSQFNGSFPASATGAVATPTIDAAQIANHSVWPPTAMGPSFTANQIALFPTLTRTGAPITLAAHTHPANATAVGNGWIDSADTTGAYVTVAGCSYLNEYNATAASLVPTAACTGGATRKREMVRVVPTAAPLPRI